MGPSASAAYLLQSAVTVSPRFPAMPGAWPADPGRRKTISVVGQGPLPMPTSADGSRAQAVQALTGPSRWPDDCAAAALEALLMKPAIVVPCREPARGDVQGLLGDKELHRQAKPRRVTSLIVVNCDGLPTTAGIACMTVVEAAFGFGRSVLADAEISWSYHLDELIVEIRQVRSAMLALDGQALPQRAVLLGLPEPNREEVRRELCDLAGAYGVNLRCFPELGSKSTQAAADLAKRPPTALYVWRPFAGTTYLLEEAARRARPGIQVFDINETTREDILVEFAWGLADQLGFEAALEMRLASPATSIGWAHVRERLQELRSRAFDVHNDALVCCDKLGYGYPNPGRLLQFVEVFAQAVEKFAQLNGDIGKSFQDWIMGECGLEIAMQDSSQTGTKYDFDGVDCFDIPHIKVDDYKHGPVNAGRIHFLFDGVRHRVKLTYLGKHR